MKRFKCYLPCQALQKLIANFNNWLFSDAHQDKVLQKITTIRRIDSSQGNGYFLLSYYIDNANTISIS